MSIEVCGGSVQNIKGSVPLVSLTKNRNMYGIPFQPAFNTQIVVTYFSLKVVEFEILAGWYLQPVLTF